jgi:hypothetical protein
MDSQFLYLSSADPLIWLFSLDANSVSTPVPTFCLPQIFYVLQFAGALFLFVLVSLHIFKIFY